jgi:hypothetical protein
MTTLHALKLAGHLSINLSNNCSVCEQSSRQAENTGGESDRVTYDLAREPRGRGSPPETRARLPARAPGRLRSRQLRLSLSCNITLSASPATH